MQQFIQDGGSGALGVGALSGGSDHDDKGTTSPESKGKSAVNDARSKRERGLKEDDDSYPSFDFKRELLSEHIAARRSLEYEPNFYDFQTALPVNSSQELHIKRLKNNAIFFPNNSSYKQRPFDEVIDTASNETSESQLNNANLKSKEENNELNPAYYNKTSFTDLNKDHNLEQLSSQNSSNKLDIQLFNNRSRVPTIPHDTVEGINRFINPQNISSFSISSNNNNMSALKISYRFSDTVYESNKEKIIKDYNMPLSDKRNKTEKASSIVYSPDDLKNANHSHRNEAEVAPSNVHSTSDLKNANYSHLNETEMVPSTVYSADDLKNANYSLGNETEVAPSTVHSTDDVKMANHLLGNENEMVPSTVYSLHDFRKNNYSLPCRVSPTGCSEDLLSSCFPLMKKAFITYCANDTAEDATNMRNETLHDTLSTPLKTCVQEIFNNCSEATFRCIMGLLDIFPNNTNTTNKDIRSCKFSVLAKLLIEKINIKPLKLVPS